MHSCGFCHADLKNSNAMVTQSQAPVDVKLIDMACSQQQKPGKKASKSVCVCVCVCMHLGNAGVKSATLVAESAFKRTLRCVLHVDFCYVCSDWLLTIDKQ